MVRHRRRAAASPGRLVLALLRRGRRRFEHGRADAALDCYRLARRLADAAGDGALSDRARCAEAEVRIAHGEGAAQVAGLRAVLLRSLDAGACFAAAYNVARVCDLERNFSKGCFYAHLAIDWAECAGDAPRAAAAHNLLGNLLVARGAFGEALERYRAARALAANAPEVWRLAIDDGIGYCLVMLGRWPEAHPLLARTLRRARTLRAPYEAAICLSLAHAALERDRPPAARRYAGRALALARERRDGDAERHALVLLMDLATQNGEAAAARAYAEALADHHYPHLRGAVDGLLRLGASRFANLRG